MRAAWLGVLFLLAANMVSAGGRVPTTYNQRYQALFAEQALFRQRPELLGCVLAARDLVQKDGAAIFNKLRFDMKSVQGAYVVEGMTDTKPARNYRQVRMQGEGRVRAYSFLENWEAAEIECRFVAGQDPKVILGIVAD